MTNQIEDMKTVFTSRVNTSFEQYKDLYATLDTQLMMIYKQTTMLPQPKKQHGTFAEITAIGFTLDKRNRSFMPTDGSIFLFNKDYQYLLINQL